MSWTLAGVLAVVIWTQGMARLGVALHSSASHDAAGVRRPRTLLRRRRGVCGGVDVEDRRRGERCGPAGRGRRDRGGR